MPNVSILCLSHVFGLCAFALVCWSAAAQFAAYDVQCDTMVRHAQAAAAAFNDGNEGVAKAHSEKVHEAYHAAVAAQPNEPQAHLHMAVFLSNTHRYDEAVAVFEKARAHIGKNRQAEMQISMGIRRAKFQKYSKLRDEAYQHGAGDMMTTYRWALKQLSVTFDPHRFNHDVGTLEVMLCEYNTTYCTTSVSRFKSAAFGTQGHYMQNRITNDKSRMDCLHSKLLVGNFADGATSLVSVKKFPAIPSVAINTFHDAATVHGADGVLTFASSSHCSLATTSSDYYTNLAKSVAVRSPNGPPPMPEPPISLTISSIAAERVLLLTQFSGTAYYHWMLEAVPRLVVAARYLKDDFSSVALLLPSSPSGTPQFVTETLSALFPEIAEERLFFHKDTTVVRGEAIAVTWSPSACPPTLGSEGEASEVKPHCASLADPAALRLARDKVVAVLRSRFESSKGSRERPYVLIASRGSGTTMRQFDDEALLATVRGVASPQGFDVVVFDASQQPLVESLRLFHGAAVIVGVHGGALGNIVASPDGAALLEIGFRTIGAQQYHHAARALGVEYRRVRVVEDAHFRAIGAPRVEFSVDAVATELQALLSTRRAGLSLPEGVSSPEEDL